MAVAGRGERDIVMLETVPERVGRTVKELVVCTAAEETGDRCTLSPLDLVPSACAPPLPMKLPINREHKRRGSKMGFVQTDQIVKQLLEDGRG